MFDNNPFRDYKNWLRSLKEEGKIDPSHFTGEPSYAEHEENLKEDPAEHYLNSLPNREQYVKIFDKLRDSSDPEHFLKVFKTHKEDLHPDHLEAAVEQFLPDRPGAAPFHPELLQFIKSHPKSKKMNSYHQGEIGLQSTESEPFAASGRDSRLPVGFNDPSDLFKYKKYGI